MHAKNIRSGDANYLRLYGNLISGSVLFLSGMGKVDKKPDMSKLRAGLAMPLTLWGRAIKVFAARARPLLNSRS